MCFNEITYDSKGKENNTYFYKLTFEKGKVFTLLSKSKIQ